MSDPVMTPAEALQDAIEQWDGEYSWELERVNRIISDLADNGYRLVPISESSDHLKGQVTALRSLLNECRGAAKALVQEAAAFDESL